jgi:hypothetical protein
MRAIAILALLPVPVLAAPAPLVPEQPGTVIKSYVPKDPLDKYPAHIRAMFEGPKDYDWSQVRFGDIRLHE